VRLAHSFAIENKWVKADCIEATEFPELAGRYRVYAVPKTVVNGDSFIEGALPEQFFVESILKEIGVASADEEETP
jgi:hypothetical protein